MILNQIAFISQYIDIGRIRRNLQQIRTNIGFYLYRGNPQYNKNKFAKEVLDTVILMKYQGRYAIYNLKEGIYDTLESEELGRIIKFIMDLIDEEMWSQKREEDCIQRIARQINKIVKLPTYEERIFFNNGIYNLVTNKLEPFTHELIAFKKLSANCNPKAECPKFNKFLDEICSSDTELLKVIQELVGYCFVDNNKAQKFFVLYGNGCNGKSVLQSVITSVVGKENTSNLNIAHIGQRFSNANIVNKKVNIATENEADFETEQLKAITAGDPIMVEEKYAKAYEYVSTCKMVFFCNTLPNTKDNSYGFYRRLILIPLTKTITNPNPNLSEELKLEIDGIAKWALGGLERLIKNNYQFTTGKAVTKLLNEYKKEQDPVKSFFEQKLEYCNDSRIANKKLLEAYKAWVHNNYINAKGTDSSQKFWKELRRVIEATGKSEQYVQVKGYKHLKNYQLK